MHQRRQFTQFLRLKWFASTAKTRSVRACAFLRREPCFGVPDLSLLGIDLIRRRTGSKQHFLYVSHDVVFAIGLTGSFRSSSAAVTAVRLAGNGKAREFAFLRHLRHRFTQFLTLKWFASMTQNAASPNFASRNFGFAS